MFLTSKLHSRRRKVALATCILGIAAFFGGPAVVDFTYDAALDWELESGAGLTKEDRITLRILEESEVRATTDYRRALQVYKASKGWLGCDDNCQSNRKLLEERGLEVVGARQTRRDERRGLRRHDRRDERTTELIELGKIFSRMLRRDDRRAEQAEMRPGRRAERRAARNPERRAARQEEENPERRHARQQARRDARQTARNQAFLNNHFGVDN